jgi:hypothetical protein
MPPEIGPLVPVITLLIGLAVQPIKDGLTIAVGSWRGTRERRRVFQYDTLSALTTAMETWRSSAPFVGADYDLQKAQVEAKERVRTLTFRVADDELRQSLEVVLAADQETWLDAHGEAVRRLGQVIRNL